MHLRLSTDKFLQSRFAIVISVVVLIASIGLLAYEDARQINGWHPFGISLRLPGFQMQARAGRYAFSVYCQRNTSVKSADVAFGRNAYLFNPPYHHGVHFEALSFGFACLLTTYNGGDYVVTPHIAIGIPFWFTATASGLLILYALLAPTSSPQSKGRIIKN